MRKNRSKGRKEEEGEKKGGSKGRGGKKVSRARERIWGGYSPETLRSPKGLGGKKKGGMSCLTNGQRRAALLKRESSRGTGRDFREVGAALWERSLLGARRAKK